MLLLIPVLLALALALLRGGALSDIIPVRLPGGPGNVYSSGDVLLVAGIALLVYRATRSPFALAPSR